MIPPPSLDDIRTALPLYEQRLASDRGFAADALTAAQWRAVTAVAMFISLESVRAQKRATGSYAGDLSGQTIAGQAIGYMRDRLQRAQSAEAN